MPLLESSHIPVCTYRVQLNGRFTFADLGDLVPYLCELGISDFYLSPIFAAVPGSLHGYDVTDYCKINPELGGSDSFDVMAKRIRDAGCAILIDFVPNHMGIAGILNRWWSDVLENGRLSPYARFFDIHWKEESNQRHSRVLVPILEDHYGKVLEQGKIILAYTGGFALRYGDTSLPISPSSYTQIFEPLYSELEDVEAAMLTTIVNQFANPAKSADAAEIESARKRVEAMDRLKNELNAFIAARPSFQPRLTNRLKQLNGVPDNPGSFDELHRLIEQQHYRLARWKTGAHEINYRRFFAIDSLVGLHMEKTDVFRECHELLGRLIRDGKVTGLRIDHIDGLRQPEDYLQRLQALDRPDISKPLYVLVEKILAPGEALPERWPVHGTTGYEFILALADLFVSPVSEPRFNEIYRNFTGENIVYTEVIYNKKRLIIAEMFVNAVSNLGAELVEIIEADRHWRDLTRHELTTVVSELMANLPVYRAYRRRQHPVSLADRLAIEEAYSRALARNPRADPEPFAFVRDLLIGIYPTADAPEDYRASLLSWVLTFQQYTGAVMAKAVEDTAFYTYNRLVVLNEVGGDPGRFGRSVDDFHCSNRDRLARSPHTMLTTSTHDTKFSEDIRARLYVLSELPDEWETWLRGWQALTARHTTLVEGNPAPDALDIYRFYQVLLGMWPLDSAEVDEVLRGRLREHLRKAVNEAKRHTSILQSNDAYLEACDRFVDGVTSQQLADDFLHSFLPCAQRVARLGMVNSLSQLVLKCTVPGIPDFYQGNEIWDFSLVDPDNRRDVNYSRGQKLIDGLANATAAGLLENWRDGSIKLRVMQVLLRFRGQHPQLFSHGQYEPVKCEGGYCDHVVAFTRSHEADSLLVVVPRLTAKLGSPPLGMTWDDTRLVSQGQAQGWRDLFTDRIFSPEEPLFLRALFADLPIAVLQRN